MGIIHNIINSIRIRKLDGRIKSISDRINQLHRFKSEQDKHLGRLKSEEIDASWYKVSKPASIYNVTVVFVPRQMEQTKTMADLVEKRRKDEEERQQRLKQDIIKSYDTIDDLLVSDFENVKPAEDLLYQIAATLDQIQDEALRAKFDEYKEKISSFKEVLQNREIERIERKAKEEAEREQRKKEQERLAQERAEKERQEREQRAKEYEERLAREAEERALEIARLTALVTRQKDNAQAYINHLNLHGVKCFYHFTEESNLQSIRKLGGLYSWYYCQQNDIEIPSPGGDSKSRELDSRQGLQNYVRLSFCRDHPMAYRLKQAGKVLRLLQIKIDVAAFIDTQFSNINAADNENQHGKDLEDLQRVNIWATQQTYVSKDSLIFKEHQAECMVETFIPSEYIININNPT